ncbi:hypothetical protein tooticki91_gp013 [Flavobacterium phage vB_FspS_tooticki9-1]|uniref:Uncharacterized protein n=23 Tax=Caudoviricetes TaxID=2731619 RepID=A0A6B9LH03_9CAUD|nr:hypothetical protein HWC87_gp19 [Flavobacterium phage vB_FspS_filifjonk9-1]YP_009854663.1 hypothetical protein HWC88_gp11 [Flavobacterium phage vB_FspS_hattifnatt9-1]YP_009854744.1 hypothetical protein HWC89_gp16 [Flavobacterium phage vB_FspS_hemulen6-1]YP_009855016.1 hypothetical protein HWC93_gp15 [Flavobacterium phage vB_FspS_mumin9-1]YP_009855084.1 hypothetical protein HWC94_gp16 [Flavobacterium phage vB_FspS_mymlan6-1]YP_009855155.1 hypothetical protein HWC95_gp19 [Flavobacterium phage
MLTSECLPFGGNFKTKITKKQQTLNKPKYFGYNPILPLTVNTCYKQAKYLLLWKI